MIEATVQAANSLGPSPPDLLLSFWCGDSRLPDAGGVLDQDYITMQRMASLRNIYNAISRYSNALGEDIHRLSTGERRILRMVLDMGIEI